MTRSLVVASTVLLAACDPGTVPLADTGGGSDTACSSELDPSAAVVTFDPTGVLVPTSKLLSIANHGPCGTLPLSHQIIGAQAAEFVVASSTCNGLSLAPGVTCTVDLTFTPEAAGGRGAVLQISGGASQLPVALSGTGLAVDRLTIQPTWHEFGIVYLDQPSPTKTFTVVNIGGVPLTSVATSLAGSDPGEAQIASTTCTGSLSPGDSCAIAVRFMARSTGAKSAAVVVTSSDGTVTGGITGNSLLPPTLDVTPSVTDFGPVIVGQSAQQMIIVTNPRLSMTGPLHVTLAGPDATQFPVSTTGCEGVALPASGTCTIDVRFSPTGAPGLRSAQLNVMGMPGGFDTAILSGTAASAGDPTVAPTSTMFADTAVGTSSGAARFTVTQTGSAATGAYTVQLLGAEAGEFHVDGDTCQGQSVPPLGSCTVDVSFRPTTSGPHTATLQLTAAPGGTQTAVLSGTGLGITATPASVDFGFVGATSPDATVIITNPTAFVTGILRPALSGPDAAEFAITADSCNGVQLGAFAMCPLRVRMKCGATNVARHATLDVVASTGGEVHVPLTGTIPNDACLAFLTINPTFAPFGDQLVGVTSAPLRFAVANNGDLTATQLAVTVTGADAAAFAIAATTCGATLVPNASCTIDVTVKPPAAGPLQAVLRVTPMTGTMPSAALSANGVP